MNNAFISDSVCTPIRRYGGSLSSLGTDDLGAIPISALMDRNPYVAVSEQIMP
jgi:acetyl-CoA acyltransferase